MNNRDRILVICNRHNLIPQATVELAEEIIAIIKEDGSRPNLRPYQQKAIDDLRESFKEPKLIQGYTVEQWQEIIDGGYLCEFGIVGDKILSRIGMLTGRDKSLFVDDREHNWQFCRPAQIKGVMRPIFVKPSKTDAICHFFSGGSGYLGTGKTDELFDGRATKYIEL